MIQDKFILLPDGMESLEVQKNFDELLSDVESKTDLDVLDVMEALYQLADRQWHTYTILPAEYKKRVERWIGEHWLSSSLDFVRNVGFIAGSLGLPGLVHRLDADSRDPLLKDDVRREIINIVEELTPKIHDPYHDMPGRKS